MNENHLNFTSLEEQLENNNEKIESPSLVISDTSYSIIENQGQAFQPEIKMNLNGLINILSHNLNTPLGIGITASSYCISLIQELLEGIGNKTQNIYNIKNDIEIIHNSINLIQVNLIRSVELLNNFRNIDVNNYYDNCIRFNLSSHILSLSEVLKKDDAFVNNDFSFKTEISNDVFINSYPLAFKKIIEILIENSMKHGFENMTGGQISISLKENFDSITLSYSDNGHGIKKDVFTRFFEPFFTTTMNSGSIGLGLYIVYNLVTQKLRGNIKCIKKHIRGTKIIITMNN